MAAALQTGDLHCVEGFVHRHAAHCESGVMAQLLGHAGLELSEAAVFGLSAALTFAHLPMVKVNEQPLTSYRMPPGQIVRGLEKRLGIGMRRQRYRHPVEAMTALDRHIDEGRPVGLQTSVYWLPYFPEDMRFHFNAHNLIVYGREGNDYLISDPVFEHPVRAHRTALMKARFARGPFAPRGLLYYPERVPESPDYAAIARRAIRRTTMMMRYSPVPWIGIRGIRYLARRLEKLPHRRVDDRQRQLFVAQVIRMQEEIGTGGGGFRYLYAAFLQEVAEWTGDERFSQGAEQMARAADGWRAFALAGARYVKSGDASLLAELPERVRECAALERQALGKLW
ncbi:BtrH N-terminal domain-containing protein [Natronospira bacteriovora]|uniref:BtrH N-terminal domain-containing protein n=1 Tax=Natronospira bacteriovora TaxID=3069753 RepID=A0ABU0W8C9_9GAMM|nr:BtrH N-terminal domain-containing protein [Natronospira sp. AB-CW4]MDQ2070003.1 BtrH N-terminal domain-containing protein [Natronospira sp. AB-CW4]